MPEDINLLPQQTDLDKQHLKQQKLINMVSAIALGLAILVVLVLLGGKLYIDSTISSINSNISAQEQQIKAKQKEEFVARALSDKIAALGTFFSSQKHYSTFLTELSKTLPNSLTLTDLTVDSANTATITGKVGSYADLAGFYAKLSKASPQTSAVPYFTGVSLNSINRGNQSGDITFGISFNLAPTVLAASEGN